MKRILLLSLLSLMTCVIFSIQAFAQEISGDKVTVQITKDGKVITDTILLLKEGQDPEAVKKVIAHVLEGDIEVISGKEGHQKMVWVTSHAEDIDVDMDSVMKHEEKVMIFEGEGSKIIIIEKRGDKECEGHQKYVKVYVEGDEDIDILDDEDLEWVEKEDEDNVDVYVIKKDDGTEVVKTVKVEVTVDEEDDKVNDDVAVPSQKEPSKPEKKKK